MGLNQQLFIFQTGASAKGLLREFLLVRRSVKISAVEQRRSRIVRVFAHDISVGNSAAMTGHGTV
jgi:hypothetical protein